MGDLPGSLLGIPRARMERSPMHPPPHNNESTNPRPSLSPQSSDVVPAPHPVSLFPIAGVRHNGQTSPPARNYPGLATYLVWSHGRHEAGSCILCYIDWGLPALVWNSVFPTLSQPGDHTFFSPVRRWVKHLHDQTGTPASAHPRAAVPCHSTRWL